MGNASKGTGTVQHSRPSARQRGYDARWDKARLIYLRQNPLCALHWAKGQIVQAKIVDHIVPHRGDQKLFWDQTNWQPMCEPCHNSHKQSEEKLGYSKEIGADGWPIDPRYRRKT